MRFEFRFSQNCLRLDFAGVVEDRTRCPVGVHVVEAAVWDDWALGLGCF
jgi:hypothetical protein